MPRRLGMLVWAMLLVSAAAASAQSLPISPPRATSARWGDRPQAAPQIPWTGGAAADPATPQLLPTTYQAPTGDGPRPIPQPVSSSAARPLAPAATTDSANPALPKLSPLASAGASLGIVLGLFLLVVWSVRRGAPGGNGLLPRDAVEVLGRAPIAGRQDVHLVRCGNKLVLVSAAATGVQPLTEISDPREVDSLLDLCRQSTAPVSAWNQWFSRWGASIDHRQLHAQQPDRIDLGHLEPRS